MAALPSTSQIEFEIDPQQDYEQRYRQYKAIVASDLQSGKLPSEMACSVETTKFLSDTNNSPVTAVDAYLKKKNLPCLNYYGYELNTTLRKKFFCLTEYNGQAFYGVRSPTKKEARAACLLRLLDYLINQDDLLQVLSSKTKVTAPPPSSLGKKGKRKAKKRTFFGGAPIGAPMPGGPRGPPVPLNKLPRYY